MESSVQVPEENSQPQSLPEPQESGPVQYVYSIGSQTQDKSRRLIQRQLILLLHAHNCQKKDRAFAASYPDSDPNSPLRPECTIQQCKNMKDVWDHMRKCTVGQDCQFLHCASSLKILAHWKHCTTWECPVCHLIRLKGAQQVGASLTMKAAETARALAPKQLHSGLQMPLPAEQMNYSSSSSFTNHVPAQNSTNNYIKQEQQDMENEQFSCMDQDRNEEENYADYPQEEDDGIGLRGNYYHSSYTDRNSHLSVPTAEDVRRAYEQLGIPCPKEALNRLMATLPGGQNFEEDGRAAEKEDLNECSDSGFVPDDMPSIGAVADDVVHVQADEAHAESQLWRQSMSSLARERLVRQIHEAMCVTTDDLRTVGENDPRIVNSLAFAYRIELEAYHFAQSRAQYFELISDWIITLCQEIVRDHCLEENSDEEEIYTEPVEQCQLLYQHQNTQSNPIGENTFSSHPQQTNNSIINEGPRNIQQLLEGFPCAYQNRNGEKQSDINLENLIQLRYSPQASPTVLKIPTAMGMNYNVISSCGADCQGGPNCPFSLT